MGSQIARGDVLIEPALAKVNLSLHVIARRTDGYRLIESLICFADLGERLTARIGERVQLDLSGPMHGEIADGENLVLAADAAFRKAFPHAPPVAYHLEKHIPVAAGLGGGSADAAAALRLLARLSGISTDHPQIACMALELGADVPVCLCSQPALVGGIGEEVRIVDAMPDIALVLVNPRIAVSTAEVFGALGLAPGELLARAATGAAPFAAAQFEQALIEASNDLQAPACAIVPEIDAVIDRIAGAPGCIAARMSGSGATCFGVFADDAAAGQAARDIAAAQPGWWVRPARTGGAVPADLV